MRLFDYQKKAVDAVSNLLVEHISDIADISIEKREKLNILTKKVVFKAPTGSGKTVISFAIMNNTAVESPTDLVFIWLAPNTLHNQAYTVFKRYKANFSSSLNPIQFDDIQDNILRKNDLLCLNWDSVNKDSNERIAKNESGKYLENIIHRTKESGCELVVLVDEAHIGASGKNNNDGGLLNKAKSLLISLNPVVQLDITATPKETPDVVIHRNEVVDAGVIKKAFWFNHFSANIKGNIDMEGFVTEAYHKLLEIKAAYQQKSARNINPLLVIQIENKNSDGLETQRDSITQKLVKLGVHPDKIVSYLSEDIKDNTALTQLDNPIEVIFTKTAIATGWDCPRASVLLTIRNSKTDDFKTQVLGRISRMPELKHYNDPLLDNAFIYSNIDSYIPAKLDSVAYNGLIVQPQEVSLKEEYVCNPTFRLPLYTDSDLDVKTVYNQKVYTDAINEQLTLFIADIEKNRHTENETSVATNIVVEDIDASSTGFDNLIYLKSNEETTRMFNSLLRRYYFSDDNGSITNTSKNALRPIYDSYPLMNTVMALLRTHLKNPSLSHYETVLYLLKHKTTFEFYLKNIHNAVHSDFMVSIEPDTIFQGIAPSILWRPPLKRVYSHPEFLLMYDKNIYDTEYTQEGYNTLEVNFRCFLDKSESVEYWMKNGDNGSDYFSIPYKEEDGSIHHFYVDFIVKHTDGTIGLYDTKPAKESQTNKDSKKLAYLASYCAAIQKSNDNVKIKYGFVTLESKNHPTLQFNLTVGINTEERLGLMDARKYNYPEKV